MVIWKNRNFRDLGIIVEYLPKIPKAKKKIDIYEIEGRNGFISIDKGIYEPFYINLECHCYKTANLDEVKKYLDGFGIISFDGEREYTAIIDNTIPFEQVQNFKKFQVSFKVNPIAEDIVATNINLLSLNEFEIETYYDISPILTIACSGNVSININNKIFYLKNTNGIYTLDCKNKEIYDSNNNNCSSLMQNDFPTFINGTNTIETIGNITAISASYKKNYL